MLKQYLLTDSGTPVDLDEINDVIIAAERDGDRYVYVVIADTSSGRYVIRRTEDSITAINALRTILDAARRQQAVEVEYFRLNERGWWLDRVEQASTEPVKTAKSA